MDQEDRIYTLKVDTSIVLPCQPWNHVPKLTVTMVITQLKLEVWPSQVMTLKYSESTESKAILLLLFYLCARVWMPQGNCIYPTLFNFFASTFPQSDNPLINSYADDFTVSCSDSNVAQMTETLTAHASNIEEWARFIHFCLKIHFHSFHPSIRAI